MKDFLVILGILILCFELYRLLLGNRLRRILKKKKGPIQPRKAQVMKPKSERDCPICVKEKGECKSSHQECQNHGGYEKGKEGPRNDKLQVDTVVPIQVANITASPM